MSDFDSAVKVVLKNEGGGFTPQDNGRGGSKWGVTLATYRRYYPEATNETIKNLGPEQAAEFYRIAFWIPMHVGLINDQELATKVFDIGVNAGPETAVAILQRAAGVVPADGKLGPHTAEKVNSQPAAVVLQAFKDEAKLHYEAIVSSRPEYSKFISGWMSRINS